MAPAVLIGLLMGASGALAADTGKVTGTITGTDGKPAEGAMVRLVEAPNKDEKKADDAAGGKKTPVATAYTDRDGKFEMKDVPAGSYMVNAGVRKVSNGHAKVTVSAGQEAQVSITLKAAGEKPEGAADGKKKGKKKGKAAAE
jgi:protocatechuate 3,4-dioxygenase beta subunit